MSPRTSQRLIPLYASDGALSEHVDERRLARLESLGLLARVVRHRKGTINRAYMIRREGELPPLPLTAYMGTKYSFLQHLNDGHSVYKLRPLGARNDDEHNLAPEIVRPIFLRVLLDCMAGGAR
jgi:hypothetical protein